MGFDIPITDNPHPNRDVVTVKLNDRIQREDTGGPGEGRHMQIETVFEMNYKSGMWRKLQFKRPVS